MVYESSANMHNVDYVKGLCQEHPEGILVYANGHGVVLSWENGEFMCTDSADVGGKYARYGETWQSTGNGLRTVEDLLANTVNLFYMK